LKLLSVMSELLTPDVHGPHGRQMWTSASHPLRTLRRPGCEVSAGPRGARLAAYWVRPNGTFRGPLRTWA